MWIGPAPMPGDPGALLRANLPPRFRRFAQAAGLLRRPSGDGIGILLATLSKSDEL